MQIAIKSAKLDLDRLISCLPWIMSLDVRLLQPNQAICTEALIMIIHDEMILNVLANG